MSSAVALFLNLCKKSVLIEILLQKFKRGVVFVVSGEHLAEARLDLFFPEFFITILFCFAKTMKRQAFILKIIFALAVTCHAHAANEPRLVVGIVIDQFRYDFLVKNRRLFSDRGFNFLEKNGISYTSAHFNYVPVHTGPGHASIYTGTVPAIHGIVGNDWYDRFEKKVVYCVDDDSVFPVGTDSLSGKKSPHRLIGSTIGDEMIEISNGAAKVIAVAVKDRSAVLPAGKAGKAFWFDDESGVFITSSYYYSSLPSWAADFNASKPAEGYMNAVWSLLRPEKDYGLSEPDDAPGEGNLSGENKPVFPHTIVPGDTLPQPKPRYSPLKASPFINKLTFEFAKAAVVGEKLGQDDVTDLLAVSLSANDYVGHIFGPNSWEVQDMILRTDMQIADFLSFLAQKIGLSGVTVFVTSDHGVSPTVSHSQFMGQSVEYLNENEMEAQVVQALNATFGKGAPLVRVLVDQYFYLNDEEIASRGLKKKEVIAELQSFLLNRPEVAYSLSAEELKVYSLKHPFQAKVQNGFYEQRSGDIYVELKPYYYFGHSLTKTGADHALPYNYDTHVPVILYGSSIPRRGFIHKRISPIDIVPTLSEVFDMPLPSVATGNVLEDVVK